MPLVDTSTKLQRLRDDVRGLRSAAVAFSGGVDSTLLLKVCHEELGARAVAVTSSSESMPRADLERTRAFTEVHGIRHVVVKTEELANEAYLRNASDRCFHCKTELFTVLSRWAAREGLEHLAYGLIADDLGDHRPGIVAARQFGVATPLADLGFTKVDVRAAARELGLASWDRPASACLASRFAYRERITVEGLSMVERAEAFLHDLGFRQVRVRLHAGDLARIEVPPEDIERLMDVAHREAIEARLRELGFAFVSVDLGGYRSGSMNRVLSEDETASGRGADAGRQRSDRSNDGGRRS